MPPTPCTSEDPSPLLWQRLKAEAAQLPLLDVPALCDLVAAVMTDWASNPVAMCAVLAAGVRCGDLPEQVLAQWESRYEFVAAQRAQPAPLETLASTGPAAQGESTPDALHPLLCPIIATIQTCQHRQGRDALAIGRLLVQARELCGRHGLHFEFVLRHIEKQHGIHRASSYLYMKFVECGFPAGLGTAVMKWIVQGFPEGGEPARAIADRALAEQLSLTQLEQRYGDLRRLQSPSKRGSAASERLRDRSFAFDSQQRRDRMTEIRQQKASLRLRRAEIDAELESLDRELVRLLRIEPAAIADGPAAAEHIRLSPRRK